MDIGKATSEVVMGWNTTILVLNDALDIVENNPLEFTNNVVQMMRGAYNNMKGREFRPGDSMPLKNHLNPMSLVSKDHADTTNVVLIGQNCSEIIHKTGRWHSRDNNNILILKSLAESLGFNLVKKRIKVT